MVGLSIPVALLFALGGASVGEPYATWREYFSAFLIALVAMGPVGAAMLVPIFLVPAWAIALSKKPRLALAGKVLLWSPLTIFPCSILVMLLGLLSELSNPDFVLREPIPAWVGSPIIMSVGSGYGVAGVTLLWLVIVTVALIRLAGRRLLGDAPA
jgi:hypothetical protein